MNKKIVQANLTSKAPSDGGRTVTVVATAPTLDRGYDIVDTKSMRIPLKNGGNIQAKDLTGTEAIDVPFMLNHSVDITDVIGSTRKAIINADGELEMTFGLAKTEKAEKVWPLLEEGHLGNNVSITFMDYEPRDGVLYDSELIEVSLVYRGSNKDARVVAVSKALGITPEKQKDVTVDVTDETTVADEMVETTEVHVETNNNKESDENEVDDTTVQKSEKKENMTNTELAAETVVESKEVVVDQPKKLEAVSKSLVMENFVNQIDAKLAGRTETLAKLAQKGAELDGADSKKLDLSNVYLPVVVAEDIKTAYVNAGGVGALVNRVDITGADIYRGFVEANGVGFQRVALGYAKPEDQPVWTPVNVTPVEWALVVAWQDGAAERTPLAVYNNVVRYIATQYKRLEDNIIFTYAGGTVNGEYAAPSGLVPLLQTAGRTSSTGNAGWDAQYLLPSLATAMGNVESDAPMTIAANRRTWMKIALAKDGDNNTIFNAVGDQISVGALGAVKIVTSELLDDETIVVGDFSDYTLVTRGGLATLFSQEATVGSLNLFTQNASAIRASVNLSGTAERIKSFWLLTAQGYVS
jgi:hypothetical protein